MNLIPHIVVWACLTTMVIILALYRRKLDMKVDDMLHVLDSEQQITASQAVVSKKLEKVDRWGKILTALAALYLVIIAGLYVYNSFTDTGVKMTG
jgi:hypothetical protein